MLPSAPERAAGAPSRLPPAVRWRLVGILVAVLLFLGTYNDQVLTFLTTGWLRGLAAVGLDRQAAVLQQGVNGGITKRLLPAVATYAALYLGVSLLLLRLLLPAPAHWLLVLRLYAGTLGTYAVLVLLGKLAGNIPWIYQLSRQILDFVVSPLPVGGLYVLLRAGPRAGNAPAA